MLSPLIRPEYIKPFSRHDESCLLFDFPLDLDDSNLDCKQDMMLVCDFLNHHAQNISTVNNYTKELEKFLQWLWRIKSGGLFSLNQDDAVEYLDFIKSPPIHWISKGRSYSKFVKDGTGLLKKNPWWRPFSTRSSQDYVAGGQTLRSSIGVIRSLYLYLIQEGYTELNPFITIKVKNPTIAKSKLTESIIEDRIHKAEKLAAHSTKKNERTLFIAYLVYDLGLKPSDLVKNKKVTPPMMSFFYIENNKWYYRLNKNSSLPVSDRVIRGFIRYRKHLGLPDLPNTEEDNFLLPSIKHGGNGYISKSKQILRLLAEIDTNEQQ